MESLDQADEWRRLKEFYARMSDGELEVVAGEAYDLTDIAKPLLSEEIARRGMKIPLIMERGQRPVVTGPPSLDPSQLDLVSVGPCWNIEDARKVKEVMDAAGIASFWGPDNLENPEGLDFNEGVLMGVPAADSARVREGLRQLFPDQADAESYVCVCPQCKSPEIIFHDLDADSKFRWSCDACGHVWEDDGIEKEDS